MITVYFDSQIFRYLKNIERTIEPKHTLIQRLNRYVSANKEHFLYFYSHAHLLDLANDKTDKKYADLQFMNSIVEDNFLIQHFGEDRAKYLLIDPITAFEEYKPDDEVFSTDFNDIFNLDQYKDLIDEKQLEELKSNIELLKDFSLGDLPGLEELPERDREVLKKFLPSSDGGFIGFLNHFLNYSKKFAADNSVYKELREYVSQNPHGVKFEVDLNTFDFTMNYADTQIQKDFLSQIKNNLDSEKATQFDLHYQGYFQLDLYGVSAEDSRKLKTGNLLHDAHHSFYGGYCDFFVSDDVQVRAKSKIIYKLFGIQTKVLSIEEFVNEAFWVTLQIDRNEQQLWEKIFDVVEMSFVRRYFQPSPDRTVTILESNQFFLSYFNELRLVQELGITYFVFGHEVKNYHGGMANYKVIESVTNKAVHLFGIDENLRGDFSYEEETNLINSDKWEGRTWKRDAWRIVLEVNTHIYKLNLVIFKDE